jgi:hypothetical protein
VMEFENITRIERCLSGTGRVVEESSVRRRRQGPPNGLVKPTNVSHARQRSPAWKFCLTGQGPEKGGFHNEMSVVV